MGGEVGAGKCRDKILKRIMNQNIALGENSLLLFYSQLLKKKKSFSSNVRESSWKECFFWYLSPVTDIMCQRCSKIDDHPVSQQNEMHYILCFWSVFLW